MTSVTEIKISSKTPNTARFGGSKAQASCAGVAVQGRKQTGDEITEVVNFDEAAEPSTRSGGLKFSFQLFQRRYHDRSIVGLDQVFGLEAAQITRYQLANGADLCSQFRVVGRKFDRDRIAFALTSALCESNQQCHQTMTD